MVIHIPQVTIVLLWTAILVLGAPVTEKVKGKHVDVPEGGVTDELPAGILSYDRYLREVVSVLEEDEVFQQKLREANVSKIKSGEIAQELDFVHHNVRTKLDEIKRQEIARLQELVRLQLKAMDGIEHLKLPAHLDLDNVHSFEVKDLEKLIRKTTADLDELDKQRKYEFKEYEMEKEYERKEKLAQLSETERKLEEQKYDEMVRKHKDHPKLNHPGSKDQLEEVWEKEDHLEDQPFNPKTFFALHDTNSDNMWNAEEVEAIMQNELDKVYDPNNPEDDPIERNEEKARMREHIFTEIDKNHDSIITRDEFLNYTGLAGNNREFEKDEGWKTVDEQAPFSDEEYQEFLRQYHNQPGLVHPPMQDPNYHQVVQQGNLQYPGSQGYPPIQHVAQQQAILAQQQAQMAQQYAQNIQQFQQQQFQQPHQQQQQFQQPPQQQQQFQQPPQQQQQFQQPPQQQQQFQQPPQHQQQQFQQPPQQQQQFQQPPQQQQQFQQPPQQQQQFQQHPQQQQQFQQPPQQQQQFQQPPQQQQQQFQQPPQQQEHHDQQAAVQAQQQHTGQPVQVNQAPVGQGEHH